MFAQHSGRRHSRQSATFRTSQRRGRSTDCGVVFLRASHLGVCTLVDLGYMSHNHTTPLQFTPVTGPLLCNSPPSDIKSSPSLPVFCRRLKTSLFRRSFPNSYAFSALTLLVGWQEGHLACKDRVVGCWHGYLSGARCRLAYGPADATAIRCLLLHSRDIETRDI